MKFTTDELRPLAILEGLPEWQLAWFCDNGDKIELATRDRMFERDQPADYMFIVVTGTIQRYEEIGGQWLVVATTRRGQVTGMLPYSRMTRYPGNTVAAEASQVLRIRKADFPQMLAVSHEVGQRLVAEMSNRVRGDVRLEQQREKMMALGRLSAGLAHELNNPASAMRRAAANLSDQLARLPVVVRDMLRHGLDEAAIDAVDDLQRLAREREPVARTALERSDCEEDLLAWLEDHGVTDAAEVAGTFADSGLTVKDLETVGGKVADTVLADVFVWVGRGLEAERLVAEMSSSAGRISELIASVKSYSHMDRSPEHKPTDVREGLDNTLTMLGHKLKKKNIRLVRDYQNDLPGISGNAGELNQVWTNLVDNAVDAMNEGGELRIEALRGEAHVEVKIIDDGPGIPDSIKSRIFEPFFTTKGVGEGTGLGLDIALRIVRTHKGQIDVESTPGRTEMCVRLPLSPAAVAAKRE